MHSKKYCRNPEISFRREQDEVILFPIGDGELIILNETAAFIWDILATPRTKAEIIGELLAEYEVLPDVAENDVGLCVATMLENCWIKADTFH